MSSEMRELVREMRAGTPCYVAKVRGGRCVNGAECLRCAERLDWADRLERALLARTEAGADGAVAWIHPSNLRAMQEILASEARVYSFNDGHRIPLYAVRHAAHDGVPAAYMVTGNEHWPMCITGTKDGAERVLAGCNLREGREIVPLYTHPQDASGDAAPVLFGRGSGGDWYVDADTKSICVDVDFDPARQLSLILKQDGRVAWSIFVQEPDSSTTKATGPSVMNTGFYEALSYIAMQAKEAE